MDEVGFIRLGRWKKRIKKKLNFKNMSRRFQSINLIEVYETDGREEDGLRSDRPKVKVSEHWNRKELVVIKIDDKEVTVSASELKLAIDNAQNAHGY